MCEKPYEASFNKEGINCVMGPGNGLGYYAHTLNPDLSCRDEEEAERVARVANIAYEAGISKAKRNIQKALGLDKN